MFFYSKMNLVNFRWIFSKFIDQHFNLYEQYNICQSEIFWLTFYNRSQGRLNTMKNDAQSSQYWQFSPRLGYNLNSAEIDTVSTIWIKPYFSLVNFSTSLSVPLTVCFKGS